MTSVADNITTIVFCVVLLIVLIGILWVTGMLTWLIDEASKVLASVH